MNAFKWIYRVADGQFLHGGPIELSATAPAEGVVALVRNPDVRTERYDATTLIRPATVQEIVDYDTEQVAQREQDRFDGERMLKAVALWAAGKLSVAPATAKTEILAIYRGLP